MTGSMILIFIGILIAKNVRVVRDAEWLELKIMKPFITKYRNKYYVCM